MHDLGPDDFADLSRLVDEVLRLEPDRLENWLHALPVEDQRWLPRLRAIVNDRHAKASARFMAGGPRILDEPSGVNADEPPPEVVGPYRLLRAIGQGGMGRVFLAERADGGLHRQVALKLPRVARDPGLHQRMALERDIGALLEHPNIARLYDANVDAAGRLYLAFEYIDGQSIDAWCESRSLAIRPRIDLFLQVVQAVAYAHGRLVVHRDIKPSNVLVTRDASVHLLDFGIAKLVDHDRDGDLTLEWGHVLTPQYASPEQLRGEPVTVASDVYSLGMLLYVLLAGTHPRVVRGPATASSIEQELPLASTRAIDADRARALRGELDAILARTLQLEPSRRYATADELAQELRRYLAGDRVLARPDSLVYSLRKAMRRHRVAFAAAAAVALSVLTGAGAALVEARRASEEAARSRAVKDFVVNVFRINASGAEGDDAFRQLPAELLLEHGADQIDSRFATQPQLRAELHRVVGEIYADMGVWSKARVQASLAMAALESTAAPRIELGHARLLLVLALSADGPRVEAEAQARRAVAELDADPVLGAEAHVLLATVLWSDSTNGEAARELDIAESRIAKGGAAYAMARAWAKRLRAAQSMMQGRFDVAGPLLLSAIDDAVVVEGPRSPAAIGLRYLLVKDLVLLDRAPEALPVLQTVLSTLRGMGRTGMMRATLVEAGFALQMAFCGQGSLGAEVSTIERARRELDAMGEGVPRTIRARLQGSAGIVRVLRGDLAQGQALLDQALPILRPVADGAEDRSELAFFSGMSAMRIGEHSKAEELLHEAIESAEIAYGPASPFTARVYSTFATNLSMAGRTGEALEFLRSLPPTKRTRNSRVAPTGLAGGAWSVEFASAAIQLDSGDPKSALDPEFFELASRETSRSDYRWLVGHAACVAGRQPEGLPLLLDGIDAYLARDPHPSDPELARIRAIAGRCALAQGRRRLSQQLAAAARQAFASQPGVSPYFQRPLIELEQALAQGRPASLRAKARSASHASLSFRVGFIAPLRACRMTMPSDPMVQLASLAQVHRRVPPRAPAFIDFVVAGVAEGLPRLNVQANADRDALFAKVARGCRSGA